MIGQRLRELREERGLKQAELAEYLEIGRTSYTQYELDKIKPDITTVKKLSDLYNVSTDYILSKTDIRSIESDMKMNDIEYALYGEVKQLTEEDQKEILNFAKYIRNKRKGDTE